VAAAIRSSALIEDRADANFAGPSSKAFLGIVDEAEFSPRCAPAGGAVDLDIAAATMDNHVLDPASTAIACLEFSRDVAARASGGA